MTLSLMRPQKISLHNYPNFCEAWLHDQICEDTSLLGLEGLDVIDRECAQSGGEKMMPLRMTAQKLTGNGGSLASEASRFVSVIDSLKSRRRKAIVRV